MEKLIKTKKKLLIVVCAIVFVLAIILCVFFYKKSVEVFNFSRDEITSAYITNGNNGEVTEVTGNDLDFLYQDLQGVSLKEVKDVESSGWSYIIDFHVGDKTISVEMISSTVWKVSDKRYEVSEKVGNQIMKDISNIEN